MFHRLPHEIMSFHRPAWAHWNCSEHTLKVWLTSLAILIMGAGFFHFNRGLFEGGRSSSLAEQMTQAAAVPAPVAERTVASMRQLGFAIVDMAQMVHVPQGIEKGDLASVYASIRATSNGVTDSLEDYRDATGPRGAYLELVSLRGRVGFALAARNGVNEAEFQRVLAQLRQAQGRMEIRQLVEQASHPQADGSWQGPIILIYNIDLKNARQERLIARAW